MRAALLLIVCVSTAFADDVRWWKGNLHTHSHWSDGDDYPEMIAAWYKERGYHFLALSDHNILPDHEKWIGIEKSKGGFGAFEKYLARFGEQWVEQRETAGVKEVRLKMLGEYRTKLEEPGRFLMIPSEEISSRFLSAPIHVNATNVREKIPEQTGRSIVEVMQKSVDAVLAQRAATGVPMFPHINHPNFGWAITAEELMQVDRERFFEVYNGHPIVRDAGDARHASVERVWDIILTRRLAELGKEVVFGLATDDAHNYHIAGPRETAAASRPSAADNEWKGPSRPGRGWVMVRAARLDAAELVTAMEAGNFYSSTGVTLKDVNRGKGSVSLEIQKEPGVSYTTEFIGTRKGYDPASEPVLGDDGTALRVTRRYSKDVGAVLATVEGPSPVYALKGDEIYVRARVRSSKLKADPARSGELEQAWTQPFVTGIR